jgi:hypothetical protein
MIYGAAGIVRLNSKGLTKGISIPERLVCEVLGIWLVGLGHVLMGPPISRESGRKSIECGQLGPICVRGVSESEVVVGERVDGFNVCA